MKSKKWLISLGLAVVLVVAFTFSACEQTSTEYWYTPDGEKISFEINTITPCSLTLWDFNDISIMVANDLADFGLDVTHRVIDASTYFNCLYDPSAGGMDAFISGECANLDPWSGYLWLMLSDPPADEGGWWIPTWYNSTAYNDLPIANFLAPNLSAKREILYEMQEILAEDLPVIYLTKDDIITVRRNDRWENWFNEMGGHITWMNEHSIREVTPKTSTTQLNIGLLMLMDSLNMNQGLLQWTDAGFLYLMLVYENLAFYPKVDEWSLIANSYAAYNFIPKLAMNYTWGMEGTNQTLTINLRSGVKWHDFDTSGETLDAEDVVYTIKHVAVKFRINMPVDWMAVGANGGEILPEHMLAEATGPLQVKLTYVDGYHQNKDYFPSAFMYDGVVPKHVFEPDERDPFEWDGNYTGTGPYMVEDFVPGDYLLLKRFDDYWGKDVVDVGLPAAEKVLFQLYADTESMLIALEKGDIDVTTDQGAPHQKIVEYMANPDIEVENVPDLSVNYLGFNLHPTEGYAPLQDLVLRKAIAHAIDKQDIIDIALGGYGEIVDSWIYNDSPMHNLDLPQYTYNTTTAANLLLAAGYTKHA